MPTEKGEQSTFSVVNYGRFQHYKQRNPPWIKVYRSTLYDYAFSRLPDKSKCDLILIWLLASQCDNKIIWDEEWITRQLSLTQKVDLDVLERNGFIVRSNGTEKPKKKSKPERDVESDVLACMDQWNRFAVQNGLAEIKKITDKRRAHILARLADKDFKLDEIFVEIARSNFLLGKVKDWRVDFDFVFGNATNFIKIMEGKYANGKGKTSGGAAVKPRAGKYE